MTILREDEKRKGQAFIETRNNDHVAEESKTLFVYDRWCSKRREYVTEGFSPVA